jgi:thioredoxin 1
MGLSPRFVEIEPQRAEIDAQPEPVMIEFGTAWCGHCIAAQPLIAAAFAAHPQVRHLRIEDGPGRRLGRSFKVKLWPTLIFLCAGREVARLVRPVDVSAIEQALAHIDGVHGAS